MTDTTTFPDPAYRDTVLAPLFDAAKRYYAGPVRDINRAHLVMLTEEGILPRDTAQKIAQALVAIDAEVDLSKLEYTGEYEDYFFLVEAELKRRLGPDVAGALHTARSRNDMDHTVFKLVLRGKTDQLLAQVMGVVLSLLAKAKAERDTPIVAYTHGQPAQPTTFGHYLAAMIEVLIRDGVRLCDARDALDHCPMGETLLSTNALPPIPSETVPGRLPQCFASRRCRSAAARSIPRIPPPSYTTAPPSRSRNASAQPECLP